MKNTEWSMGTETVTINPKKLESTKIKLEFEIREVVLEEIKAEIKEAKDTNQASIQDFSSLEKQEEVKN